MASIRACDFIKGFLNPHMYPISSIIRYPNDVLCNIAFSVSAWDPMVNWIYNFITEGFVYIGEYDSKYISGGKRQYYIKADTFNTMMLILCRVSLSIDKLVQSRLIIANCATNANINKKGANCNTDMKALKTLYKSNKDLSKILKEEINKKFKNIEAYRELAARIFMLNMEATMHIFDSQAGDNPQVYLEINLEEWARLMIKYFGHPEK